MQRLTHRALLFSFLTVAFTVTGCMMAEKAALWKAAESYAQSDECLGEPCTAEPDFANPSMRTAAVDSAKSNEPFTIVRLFYGTNRARKSGSNPNTFYNSNLGPLELGSCDVSIPKSHDYGEIERPSIWRLEFSENAKKHVVLQSVTPQSQGEFMNRLRSDVSQSAQREAFIFVHGYNVTFADAAHRTAQMAYDLKFDGPPIMYSWPSKGDITGYLTDATAAENSMQPARQFVEQIARQSGAQRIHLIAHSMGSRIAADVLKGVSVQGRSSGRPVFNEVILAAPDIDADTFKQQIAPSIVGAANRITIYASDKDRALLASRHLNRSHRLGQAGNNLVTFPQLRQIDVIDTSGVDFGFFELGHSVYGRELLGDVRSVIAGLPSDSRGLQPHRTPPAWYVPVNVVEESINGIQQTAGQATQQVSKATGWSRFWTSVKSVWGW